MKVYKTLDEWLDETENFGLRRERVPVDALPWIEEAWRLSERASQQRAVQLSFTEAEVEAAAKVLCYMNLIPECRMGDDPCTPSTCPHWRDFGKEARAALEAAAEARGYSTQEQRVSDYLQNITNGQIGSGLDPIGFLIASHASLASLLRDKKE